MVLCGYLPMAGVATGRGVAVVLISAERAEWRIVVSYGVLRGSGEVSC